MPSFVTKRIQLAHWLDAQDLNFACQVVLLICFGFLLVPFIVVELITSRGLPEHGYSMMLLLAAATFVLLAKALGIKLKLSKEKTIWAKQHD